uniref:C2H2-type domain-containing protein n=2 Tax=Phlebotomus papatasi TaxID=29031 RepID=A0A1B0DQA8_PHLPP
MHKKTKDINCPECRKVFKNETHLEKHMDFHRKLKPFMCNICGMPFSGRGSLTKHITRHKDKAVTCPHCKNVYKNSFSFKCHLKEMHKGIPFNISARSLSCTICNENFKNLDNLREHVKIHNCSSNFECGLCGKHFKRKSNMQQHIIKTHRGVSKKLKHKYYVPDESYRYSCPHCYKGFNAKSNYLNHLTVHSNERPFGCDFCEAKFKTKQHMNRHKIMKHDIENVPEKDNSMESEQDAEFP